MLSPISLSSSSLADVLSYDVFLSFRGQDVRSGFAGSLFNALREMGANTFMDDQQLRKGDEITPTIMNAIQQSRISIVIFSPNYASSIFCLEELVKIMECLKHKGRLVWPVFYKLDPCDVRHQKGSYAQALTKHERRIHDKEKMKKWRLALQDAANLSGWHFNQRDIRILLLKFVHLGRYEYELIGKIVQEVSKRINRGLANYPVGLDQSRVHKGKALVGVKLNDGVQVMSLLDVESNEGVEVKSLLDVKSNDGVQVMSLLDVKSNNGVKVKALLDVKSNDVVHVQGISGIQNQFQNFHLM